MIVISDTSPVRYLVLDRLLQTNFRAPPEFIAELRRRSGP